MAALGLRFRFARWFPVAALMMDNRRKCKFHIALQSAKFYLLNATACDQYVVVLRLPVFGQWNADRFAQASLDAVAHHGTSHFLGDGEADVRQAIIDEAFPGWARHHLQDKMLGYEVLAILAGSQKFSTLLNGMQRHRNLPEKESGQNLTLYSHLKRQKLCEMRREIALGAAEKTGRRTAY
jgi:hypothetical protein